MDMFLAFVGFVCFGVGLVWLIVSLFRKQKLKRPTWLLVAGVVLFCVAATITDPVEDVSTTATGTEIEEKPDQTETNEQPSETQPEEKPAEKPEPKPEETKSTKTEETEKEQETPTLGYDPDEFIKRFNAIADEIGSDLKIGSIKIEEGPVNDTFQYMVTDNIALIGSVNKNGEMAGVMAIMQGDGTLESGANIFIVIAQVIAATNPTLSADERGEVIEKLGLMDFVDINDIDGKVVRNGVKYTAMGSDQIGIMFGVDVAD